ncbi:MAG: GDSL-type esterase/lipase family protein [Planctomycetes bacterium]|nr:GDSL-type esterase/lipase family protein [Planctomycetota bacterium]
MKILCLGDSLTFGTGVARKDSWTFLAQERLGVRLVNRGIPGDTTGGMLARFLPEVEKVKPAVVSLMGGFNDIFFGGNDGPARANIAAMVHQSAARSLPVVVATPVPLDVATAPAAWADAVDFFAAQETGRDYAEWLRRFCAAFAVPLVDFWALFEEPEQRRLGADLYVDGLHPNGRGHALMADLYCRNVEKIVRTETFRRLFPHSFATRGALCRKQKHSLPNTKAWPGFFFLPPSPALPLLSAPWPG